MERACQGDARALDDLLRAHYERLFAVCRRLTGHDADAADAAQDAMIAIARGLRRFDRRSRFTTWTYRIAVNASLDEPRRRRRRPVTVELPLDRPDVGREPDARLDVDAALSGCRSTSARPWSCATCAGWTTPRSARCSASRRHRALPHRSWQSRARAPPEGGPVSPASSHLDDQARSDVIDGEADAAALERLSGAGRARRTSSVCADDCPDRGRPGAARGRRRRAGAGGGASGVVF